MNNIKKWVVKKTLLFCVVMFGFLLMSGSTTQAAVKNIYEGSSSKTVYLDLTGNNRKEKVKFATTKVSYSYSNAIDKLKVYVDKKCALTLSLEEMNTECYDVKYLTFANGKKCIYLRCRIDNDEEGVSALYTYDTKTKKLKKILTLESSSFSQKDNMDCGCSHIYNIKMVTSKNMLKVTYNAQMDATGYITWTQTYKWKMGKLVKNRSTAHVEQAYNSLNYTARENIDLYSSVEMSHKVCSVSKGEKILLQNIRLYKGKYYLQFKKGKKVGWIYAGQRDVFEGVELVG